MTTDGTDGTDGLTSRLETARLVCSNPIFFKNFIVAIVVGTILNVINSGDVIFEDGKEVVAWKICLTYITPFLVSSFGSFNGLRSDKVNKV